jgi:hypothetical protein
MGMPGVPIDPYLGPSERTTGHRAPEKAAPLASGEAGNLAPVDAQRSTKVRRIEDLPTAGPVAVRPLRPEELPAAGPGGRSRGAKGGAASAASDPMATAGPAARAGAGRGLRIEDLPSVSAAVRPLRPEELNPELVRRADDLLWNHKAPVGTDIPFELNGKSYVARFAIHYHEFGGTKKPWGYHKGVTLYSTAD